MRWNDCVFSPRLKAWKKEPAAPHTSYLRETSSNKMPARAPVRKKMIYGNLNWISSTEIIVFGFWVRHFWTIIRQSTFSCLWTIDFKDLIITRLLFACIFGWKGKKRCCVWTVNWKPITTKSSFSQPTHTRSIKASCCSTQRTAAWHLPDVTGRDHKRFEI